VLGGPEPPNYAAEYLSHGADVIVIGEGELTLKELLPRLARDGTRRLHAVAGIAFRDEKGEAVRTPPRTNIANLDQMPMADRASIDLGVYLNAWETHHGASSVSLICARLPLPLYLVQPHRLR
jgi:radical SAM superfamily enzyme YgiQ (UPF0313 family)